MSEKFDLEKAIEGLRSGKDLVSSEGVLMPLIKQLTEAAITAELEHLLPMTMNLIERMVRHQKK